MFVGQFMIWWFKRWLAKDQARLDAEAAMGRDATDARVEEKDGEEESKGGIGGADGTAGVAGTEGGLRRLGTGVKDEEAGSTFATDHRRDTKG